MPKRPLRPCSHPGCPNLCEEQFCEQHRVEERRKYEEYERSSDVNRKYGRAGNASVTAMRQSIPSVRCVSRKVGSPRLRKSIISFPSHRAVTTGRAI